MSEPKQFSASIVKRALSDSDYQAFLQAYANASLRGRRGKVEWQPTIEDSLWYTRWVKGESLLVLARESGLTRNELSRRFAYMPRAAGVETIQVDTIKVRDSEAGIAVDSEEFTPEAEA